MGAASWSSFAPTTAAEDLPAKGANRCWSVVGSRLRHTTGLAPASYEKQKKLGELNSSVVKRLIKGLTD
eukprot:4746205-Pyramimonas_sp.AAC.1